MARRLAIEIFVVTLVGLVLGLFGPFGSFAIPLSGRLAYWMLFALAGYAIFRPLIIVGRWVSEALHVPSLVGIGAALALAAVPMTFFVASAFNGFALPRGIDSQAFVQLYGEVWLIGLLTNGLFSLVLPKADVFAAPAPIESSAAPVTPPFLDRLPAGFGPLLALKGEDHYVRAMAAVRDTLILLRLRDAIAELPGVDGLQVHRSWWVARAAVASVRRDGRAAIITLTNATEVPVSRENVASLKAAGWL
ncbi:MAG: hypothetical protein RL367_1562 [Pseudomonadota bacterium]